MSGAVPDGFRVLFKISLDGNHRPEGWPKNWKIIEMGSGMTATFVDPLDQFLAEYVRREPGSEVQSSDLHAIHVAWSNFAGLPAMSAKGLASALLAHGFVRRFGRGLVWVDMALAPRAALLREGALIRATGGLDTADRADRAPRQNISFGRLPTECEGSRSETTEHHPCCIPVPHREATPAVHRSCPPARERPIAGRPASVLAGALGLAVLLGLSRILLRPSGRTGTIAEGGAGATGAPGGEGE